MLPVGFITKKRKYICLEIKFITSYTDKNVEVDCCIFFLDVTMYNLVEV